MHDIWINFGDNWMALILVIIRAHRDISPPHMHINNGSIHNVITH